MRDDDVVVVGGGAAGRAEVAAATGRARRYGRLAAEAGEAGDLRL
jgi:hypothetical protein